MKIDDKLMSSSIIALSVIRISNLLNHNHRNWGSMCINEKAK